MINLGSAGEPKRTRNGWSTQLGDYFEQIYEGTEAYCRGVFANWRGNCSDLDMELEGASGVVRVRFAGQTQVGGETQLRVEIRSNRNDVQKDLLEPSVDGYLELTDEERKNIQILLEDPTDPAATHYLYNLAPHAYALDVYLLMAQGVRYRIVSQAVIIQITTANSLFPWPNMTGLGGAILSTGFMLGILRQAPNFVVLPSGPGPVDGFNYGWRAAPPTYDSSSDGHTSETLEFEYGLWPELLFGEPL